MYALVLAGDVSAAVTAFTAEGFTISGGNAASGVFLDWAPNTGIRGTSGSSVAPNVATAGAITTSPLQMAMVASAVANGGTLYRPRLVKKWRTGPDEDYNNNPTWTIRRIDAPAEAFELVRGGMHDVVEDPDGTALKARVPGVVIAGKTGSAQYSKLVDGEVVDSVYTWMISFAPFDFPRYAVAMMVEDGSSGGSAIGPRLSALYKDIFEYDGTLAKEAAQ